MKPFAAQECLDRSGGNPQLQPSLPGIMADVRRHQHVCKRLKKVVPGRGLFLMHIQGGVGNLPRFGAVD